MQYHSGTAIEASDDVTVVGFFNIFYFSLSVILNADLTMFKHCLNRDGWKSKYPEKRQHPEKGLKIGVSTWVSWFHHSRSELELINTNAYTAESFDLEMNADCTFSGDKSQLLAGVGVCPKSDKGQIYCCKNSSAIFVYLKSSSWMWHLDTEYS